VLSVRTLPLPARSVRLRGGGGLLRALRGAVAVGQWGGRVCASVVVMSAPARPTPQRERPEARECQRGTQQPPRRERRCRHCGWNWDTVYRLTIRESSNTTSAGGGETEIRTLITKDTAGAGGGGAAIGSCKTWHRNAGWTLTAATARCPRPTRCNH